MIHNILAIADMTFRKIREPAYVIILLFSVALGSIASGSSMVTFNQDNLILYNIFTSKGETQVLASFLLVLLISMILAVFIGATEIPRDIETRLILVILAKPITRGQYMLGKYFGVTAVCVVFYAAGAAAILATQALKTGGAPYEAGTLAKQAYLLLSICPFVAMALMFSCFLKDIGAMIATGVYLMFAISASAIPMLVALLPRSIGLEFYLYCFYYLFPNFIYFFQPFPPFSATGGALVAYSLSLTAIFLSIGAWRMRERDLL